MTPSDTVPVLRELRLRNFRNFEDIHLVFPAAGAAVIGDNGSGKTNLLEAIYYLEIFRSFRGATDEQLVRFDMEFIKPFASTAMAEFVFVPDGRGGIETIEGWLLRAGGGQGPLPLLDDAHGGPASYALLDFDTNVYWQVLCSRGWAVLALNAVGSASYGREFCQRLAGHWGEYDLPQHLAIIDALQEEGLASDRLACTGKSYGGFLGAWAIAHDTRFRAAEQELILRVATSYFNVLAAEDNLASAVAQRDSVSRQLEQSDKRFEVGLILRIAPDVPDPAAVIAYVCRLVFHPDIADDDAVEARVRGGGLEALRHRGQEASERILALDAG